MTCRSCEHCERNPRADDYQPGCFNCEARALAAIGAHIESTELGSITPDFRRVLEQIFGVKWHQGAVQVKHWGQKISSGRMVR